MQAARESSVVGILRGNGGNETATAALKKQRSALRQWNALAINFPYYAIPSVVLAFIICRFAFNDLASYLFVGSLLSLVAEGLVIASYVQLKSWRKHPSRLLLYHSFSNVLFALATIANALRAGRSDRSGDQDDNPNSTWCTTLSFFTQLAFFAGECWLVVISLDLVVSLSNPFSSIQGNLNKYKFAVWAASGISALALITSGECQGVTTDHVCWLHVEDLGSKCLWTFILGWVALYYIFSAVVLGYAFLRISRGLESTYETRKSCVVKHLSVLLAYVGYALLLLLLYVGYVVSEDEEGDSNSVGDNSGSKTLEYVISLLIGSRGVVDALLWFRMHKTAPSPSGRTVSVGGRLLSMVSTSATDRQAPLLPPPIAGLRGSVTSPIVAASDIGSVGSGHTTTAFDSTDAGNRRSQTSSGGAAGLAFRLWNGGSFVSGDRDSCARVSSSATHGQRLSNIGNSDDRYGNSLGGPSLGPLSIAAGPDEDLPAADDDDLWVDYSLNPQLNLALRQEVLHFVTQGILQSLHRATSVAASLAATQGGSSMSGGSALSDSAGEERLDRLGALPSVGSSANTSTKPISADISSADRASRPPQVDYFRSDTVDAFLESMMSGTGSAAGGDVMTEAYDYSFRLDEKHNFRDRYPLVFRKLRALLDISDDWYAHQIALPARERLAEGASGAFMFFCGAGEFMVKTVSAQESRVLCSILSKYTAHLADNPASLLVRFMGLHELSMYNQTFNFVVMKNIFPPKATINLKYDIKGSWVNRSASGLMPPGTRSFCKHCGEPFRMGTSGKCPERIGVHEPNLVLKDNDLTTKIRMKPEEAFEVIDALHKDSDALCQMGITDYSLLVGVRNLSYDVDPEATLFKRSKSFAHSSHERESFDCLSASGAPVVRRSIITEDTGGGVPPFEVSDTEDKKLNEEIGFETVPQTSYVPPLTNTSRLGMSRGSEVGPACDGPDVDAMQGGYAARAVIAPGLYYFGIVDILQTWSYEKILEKYVKVYCLGQPENGISCMHPDPYRERFQKKVSEVIEHSIFVRQVTGSWKGKRELTGPTSLIQDP